MVVTHSVDLNEITSSEVIVNSHALFTMLASEPKQNSISKLLHLYFQLIFHAFTEPCRWGTSWPFGRWFTAETKRPLSLEISHESQFLLIPYPMCYTNSCFTVWNVLFLSKPHLFTLELWDVTWPISNRPIRSVSSSPMITSPLIGAQISVGAIWTSSAPCLHWKGYRISHDIAIWDMCASHSRLMNSFPLVSFGFAHVCTIMLSQNIIPHSWSATDPILGSWQFSIPSWAGQDTVTCMASVWQPLFIALVHQRNSESDIFVLTHQVVEL